MQYEMDVNLLRGKEGRFVSVTLLSLGRKTLPHDISSKIATKLQEGNYHIESEARDVAMDVLKDHGYEEKELRFNYF